VTVHDSGKSATAEIGDEIPLSATVTPGALSRCDLGFGSLGLLRIMADSSIELSAMDLTEGRRVLSIKLESGRVLAKVAKLGSRDRFGVVAGSTACSVRGTEFVVETVAGGEVRIAVREGSVAVLPSALGPEALRQSEASEAVYSRLLAAAPQLEAGHEASYRPKDMEPASRAWARAAPALEAELAKTGPKIEESLASAAFTQALASMAAAEAPLAEAAQAAGTRSLEEFAEFESMPEVPGQPQAAPRIPLLPVDEFSKPAFEASLDPALWDVAGPSSVLTPRQRAGKLRFEQEAPATTDSEVQLVAKAPQFPLGRYRALAATLELGPTSPEFSHIAINLRTPGTSEGDFWIEADLINKGNHPGILARVGYSGPRGDRDEYRFEYEGGLSYGRPYDLRIELEPSGTIVWLLGVKRFASTKAPGLTANADLPAQIVLNSLRSKGAFGTTSAGPLSFAAAP
jgi:hypothetical protein